MTSRGVAVCTRASDELADYRDALAAIGLATVALPVTTTELTDPEPLARLLQLEAGSFRVIVASARAAQAVVAAGPFYARFPVVALGEASARPLRAADLRVEVPPLGDHPDALALADYIIANHRPPFRIVVPRAEGGREGGIAKLRAAGFFVDDVVAYRTVPIAAADQDAAARAALDRPDAIACLFAPSQVAALGRADLARYAAIGRTTAAALVATGVPAARIATAATPTPAGLAAAIQTVYPRDR